MHYIYDSFLLFGYNKKPDQGDISNPYSFSEPFDLKPNNKNTPSKPFDLKNSLSGIKEEEKQTSSIQKPFNQKSHPSSPLKKSDFSQEVYYPSSNIDSKPLEIVDNRPENKSPLERSHLQDFKDKYYLAKDFQYSPEYLDQKYPDIHSPLKENPKFDFKLISKPLENDQSPGYNVNNYQQYPDVSSANKEKNQFYSPHKTFEPDQRPKDEIKSQQRHSVIAIKEKTAQLNLPNIFNNSHKTFENNESGGYDNKSPSKEFKSQLPHIKEKTQKSQIIKNEEGLKQVFPKFIESRTRTYEDKNLDKDKGFYNEGMAGTKEPPKKINFNFNANYNTNINPFASSINLEEVKQNATFSKHIFEDKTIIEILEKKMGKSINNTEGDFGDITDKVTGRKKDILIEKKGKIVVEKGEHHSDPYARMGHILFKLLSIISYLSLSSSTTASNVIYQAVIILSAVDFWMVKNVSARY